MRVVLDTNVVISALLFRGGPLVTIREAWMAGRFTPLIDRPCADELFRALTYPKFQLSRGEIEALLADYLPITEVIETAAGKRAKVPVCRDPDDQKFLILAEVGRADVLVTGDSSLLVLAGQTRFTIERPRKFVKQIPEVPGTAS